MPFLFLLLAGVCHAEDVSQWPKVMMPTGEIPAGAHIKVQALPAGESVVATPEATRPLSMTANSQMMKVTEVQSPQIPAVDQADLTAQAQQGSLRVATSDLASSAVCTTTATGFQSCQTRSALPVSIAAPTNPNYFYPALAAPTNMAAPIGAAGAGAGDSSGMLSLLAGMTSALGQSNNIGSPAANSSSAITSEICDSPSQGSSASALTIIPRRSSMTPRPGQDPGSIGDLAKSLSSGAPPSCGLKQAQEAFAKGQALGKVKNDVMIVNDFQNGAAKGRMWFVNSNGTLANVGVANPLEVARGDGGFGSGGGSGKTPNGALYTSAVHWRGNANVKDGIELNGLDEENRNTVGRGILLHGWNPNSVTHGCLGIPGTLTTGRGKKRFGGELDHLKTGLLKNGGVLIYNFTPKKAAGC